MEIAYPFKIYKNIHEEMNIKKSLIHINTLAQICFRASTQAPDYSLPHLILLDEHVVEGVNQPGVFEINFANNCLRRRGEVRSFHSNEKGYRLGIFHEGDISDALHSNIKQYEKAILLHGELKVMPQRKGLHSSTKDVIIQWITF
ncbi:hypothetical protein [Alkalicoccobacillus plakortidis]|uniref:Uncharacterized protein n=1 Tax=Alkalicoccobacillus plakortidis TaxID=444060 RepID=A0ABT0XL14_9BACI|nr:hypothetical protein [Alkalicoccobacillus plakortidis]MCM2676425.1 hypothetical protein [Alkalicoccobacillus plakortidis]